jgi:hypothetical protein
MIHRPTVLNAKKSRLETSGCEINLSPVLIHENATTYPGKKTHHRPKMQ